ncbi:hypothetical protein RMSM_01651 [Rhodopirellula maiorica SM1]|uniref:Uncharacterized protein n=1 Tax=Rhodopirellula maiorica SM1 TaxID=1265738 RepID=M5S5E5_9BACT|nr:hypothetical protein RMSM_01651 [Rhodopirellula maiorica SM1]
MIRLFPRCHDLLISRADDWEVDLITAVLVMWNRLPDCRGCNDRLEAYPTLLINIPRSSRIRHISTVAFTKKWAFYSAGV